MISYFKLENRKFNPVSENNPVKVMTDTIMSIPSLQEAFKQVMSDPVNFIIFIVIFLFLILNNIVKNNFLLTYWERREDKKQEKIDRYLSNNSDIDEMCAEIVREQRDAIIFKSVTGIYAEKVFRCALIDLRKKMPYDVTWRMIRKSLSRFILIDDEFNNKVVSVKPVTKMEKLTIVYNYTMAFLLLVIAVVYINITIVNAAFTVINVLIFFVLVFLAGFCIAIILSQNLPYIFSKRIHIELQKEYSQAEKCQVLLDVQKPQTSATLGK
jgi:energy-converting hydrogenase Eha subunit C